MVILAIWASVHCAETERWRYTKFLYSLRYLQQITKMSVSSSMTSSLGGSVPRQDIVKIAVQSQPPLPPNKQPLLLDVPQSMQLAMVVRDICSQWSVDSPDRYALKYVDPPPNAASAKFGYITEDNRQKLKNGDILRLALTPVIQAEELFPKIRSKNAVERHAAVQSLGELSRDYIFALEFIKLNGIVPLMSMVEAGQLVNDAEMKLLADILTAFQELMEHGIVSWDNLTENFVKKLINFIHKSLGQNECFRSSIVSKSMAILESIVLNSPKFYATIAKEVSVSSPLPFLERSQVEVKYNTMAFINAVVAKAPNREEVMRDLSLNRFNKVLQDHVLNHFHGNVPQAIAHELYVYQCHVMNLVENRTRMRFVNGDPKMEDDLRLLPTRAFPDEYGAKGRIPIADQHWKQLGFLKGDPALEFSEAPPGILALDCMVYFAKSKHEIFTRLLFAHTENQCPFAQMSVALTKVLCQIFRVGEPPSEIGYDFISVLIWNEEPFKEVFCTCIQLLFKTWREMKASVVDQEKVMAVVTKQITTVLQAGVTLTSFDQLKSRLFDLNYKKITEAEENTQLLDDSVISSKPVRELCDRIKPEIYQLVKEERLRHLVEGQAFPKIVKRGRDQFFYCRLSPNHKFIHFGDCTGNQTLAIEALDKRIQVSEMRLEVGLSCPHASTSTVKKGANPNIFSVFYEGDEHLDFIAPTVTVFNVWVDGLSALLGRRMASKASEEDVETLLNMDLKLRLLDIENVQIPTQTPPIPKEPADYDFYYKLDT